MKFVKVFVHTKYVYQLGYDGADMLEFVHVRSETGTSMIIVGPYRLGLDLGKYKRLCKLRHEISKRKRLRLFYLSEFT